MKPYLHSKTNVSKYGGEINDYLKIHQFMDSSKSSFGDNRHRGILHHSFGIFITEQMFGIDYEELNKLAQKFNWTEEEIKAILDFKEHCRNNGKNILNSNNKQISVRDIAEIHCLEDFSMRFIPSVSDYLSQMEARPWMSNALQDIPESYRKIAEKQIKIRNVD